MRRAVGLIISTAICPRAYIVYTGDPEVAKLGRYGKWWDAMMHAAMLPRRSRGLERLGIVALGRWRQGTEYILNLASVVTDKLLHHEANWRLYLDSVVPRFLGPGEETKLAWHWFVQAGFLRPKVVHRHTCLRHGCVETRLQSGTPARAGRSTLGARLCACGFL